MTIEDIKSAIRTMKQAGNTKLPLPLNVVEKLIEDAEALKRMSALKSAQRFNAIDGRL